MPCISKLFVPLPYQNQPNNLKPNKMKTIKELYESPKRDENLEKYGHMTNQCVCCGKPMKEGEKLYVHMNEDWLAIHPGIATEDCEMYTGSKSQGCFPIGNSCAKKMTGFTFKLD